MILFIAQLAKRNVTVITVGHGVNERQQNAFLSEHSPVETAKHPEAVLELRQTLMLDHFILLQTSFVIL